MSIYEALKSDHKEAKELLTQIEELSPRATAQKQRLFDELKAKQTAHSRAEEKVLYDTLKLHKNAKDDAFEGYEEHHVVDVLFRELSRLAPNEEQWKAKFTVLKELVEHHIEEEEGEIFSKARNVLDDEEADDLGEKFEAEKSRRLEKLED